MLRNRSKQLLPGTERCYFAGKAITACLSDLAATTLSDEVEDGLAIQQTPKDRAKLLGLF
jgi:hypothetical protein